MEDNDETKTFGSTGQEWSSIVEPMANLANVFFGSMRTFTR